MKRIACCVISLFLVALSQPPAWADDGNRMSFQLDPGESRTVFASGLGDASMIQVFKICVASPTAYGASVTMLESGKGPANAANEAIASGACVFAAGSTIIVTADQAPSPEALANRQEAARRARLWLEDRVATLKAAPERSDDQDALLKGFETRLEEMNRSKTAMTDTTGAAGTFETEHHKAVSVRVTRLNP
ncbi:MAG: hypothetical protein VYC38_09525 [Pseudomonadota bacterium]|nr:hypothetical protein [Pseudomonadota bacterium]